MGLLVREGGVDIGLGVGLVVGVDSTYKANVLIFVDAAKGNAISYLVLIINSDSLLGTVRTVRAVHHEILSPYHFLVQSVRDSWDSPGSPPGLSRDIRYQYYCIKTRAHSCRIWWEI